VRSGGCYSPNRSPIVIGPVFDGTGSPAANDPESHPDTGIVEIASLAWGMPRPQYRSVRKYATAGAIPDRLIKLHRSAKLEQFHERSVLPHPLEFGRGAQGAQFLPGTPDFPVARVEAEREVGLNRRARFGHTVVPKNGLDPTSANLMGLDGRSLLTCTGIREPAFRLPNRQRRKRPQYLILERRDGFVAFRCLDSLSGASPLGSVTPGLSREPSEGFRVGTPDSLKFEQPVFRAKHGARPRAKIFEDGP